MLIAHWPGVDLSTPCGRNESSYKYCMRIQQSGAKNAGHIGKWNINNNTLRYTYLGLISYSYS